MCMSHVMCCNSVQVSTAQHLPSPKARPTYSTPPSPTPTMCLAYCTLLQALPFHLLATVKVCSAWYAPVSLAIGAFRCDVLQHPFWIARPEVEGCHVALVDAQRLRAGQACGIARPLLVWQRPARRAAGAAGLRAGSRVLTVCECVMPDIWTCGHASGAAQRAPAVFKDACTAASVRPQWAASRYLVLRAWPAK